MEPGPTGLDPEQADLLWPGSTLMTSGLTGDPSRELPELTAGVAEWL
eukprot:CAMPEP_0171129870 /NCGR_PEP_ID=MMETSP0766_2-20121228/119775_1 /TAXON_ID=439317 /ORGANISM="Gambierdiscus australes, Strain CAWD 149" /LENGTH=46 /DNA_ID= /DNA_START= /DNA_END= /DNA_ORIENTATION=